MLKVIKHPVLLLLPIIIFITACSQPPEPSSVQPVQPIEPTLKKIALDDSETVLDLLPILPVGFERIDAASEGLSNEDMGLGSDFGEVEVFLSEDPYQLIFTYMGIIESRIEQASSDTFLKDDEMVEDLLVESIKAGAAEEGVDLDVLVSITHPQIGDLAVLGEGTMSSYGYYIGYDVLMFKVNKVYVFVWSMYYSEDHEPLLKIGREIVHRINMYSH